MRVVSGLATTCDGLFDRVLCILGALLFAQGPEFIQQYAQRLGGHADEAQRQVDQYRHTAEASNLTLDQLIHQTSTNADPAVAKLGPVISSALERWHSLRDAQSALMDAPWWDRPVEFFRHFDSEIARATWAAYKPALPTTAEALLYGLIGMVIISSLYHMLFRLPVRTGYRRWRKRRGLEPVEI